MSVFFKCGVCGQQAYTMGDFTDGAACTGCYEKRIAELEAENKRLRDLAKSVVRYTGTRLEDDEKERLRSEILNTAMNLLLKPEPPKGQNS